MRFMTDAPLANRVEIGGEKNSRRLATGTAPNQLPMRTNARKHYNGYSVAQPIDHSEPANGGECR